MSKTVRADEAVHLASHPDVVREIDARLDREADSRDERALFARLEVVDVRTGAVQVARIDRVPGAVDEVLAESALRDHRSRGIVHLAAAQRPCAR